MSWGDVGKFAIEDSAPWWATVGLPVVTFWLGQRWSRKAATEQREADAAESDKNRDAETGRLRELRVAERDTNREQRIFDHKRNAHAEFLSEVSAQENAIIVNDEHGGRPPDQTDYMVPITAKMNDVDIYGSLVSAQRAKELTIALINWAESSGDNIPPRRETLRQAKQDYVFAARGDIGIVEQPSVAAILATLKAKEQDPDDTDEAPAT